MTEVTNTKHKLLLMAHSQKHYTLLGKMIAKTGKNPNQEFYDKYIEMFLDGVKHIAKV